MEELDQDVHSPFSITYQFKTNLEAYRLNQPFKGFTHEGWVEAPSVSSGDGFILLGDEPQNCKASFFFVPRNWSDDVSKLDGLLHVLTTDEGACTINNLSSSSVAIGFKYDFDPMSPASQQMRGESFSVISRGELEDWGNQNLGLILGRLYFYADKWYMSTDCVDFADKSFVDSGLTGYRVATMPIGKRYLYSWLDNNFNSKLFVIKHYNAVVETFPTILTRYPDGVKVPVSLNFVGGKLLNNPEEGRFYAIGYRGFVTDGDIIGGKYELGLTCLGEGASLQEAVGDCVDKVANVFCSPLAVVQWQGDKESKIIQFSQLDAGLSSGVNSGHDSILRVVTDSEPSDVVKKVIGSSEPFDGSFVLVSFTNGNTSNNYKLVIKVNESDVEVPRVVKYRNQSGVLAGDPFICSSNDSILFYFDGGVYHQVTLSCRQSGTSPADFGRVLVGGEYAGTFGESLGFDQVPINNSVNLINSGALKTSFDFAHYKTFLGNFTVFGVGAVSVEDIPSLLGVKIIDSVKCLVGESVLLLSQNNPVKNGVWVVQDGSWVRWVPPVGVQLHECLFFASSGDLRAGRGYFLKNDSYVVGSSGLDFVESVYATKSIPGKLLASNEKGILSTNVTLHNPPGSQRQIKGGIATKYDLEYVLQTYKNNIKWLMSFVRGIDEDMGSSIEFSPAPIDKATTVVLEAGSRFVMDDILFTIGQQITLDKLERDVAHWVAVKILDYDVGTFDVKLTTHPGVWDDDMFISKLEGEWYVANWVSSGVPSSTSCNLTARFNSIDHKPLNYAGDSTGGRGSYIITEGGEDTVTLPLGWSYGVAVSGAGGGDGVLGGAGGWTSRRTDAFTALSSYGLGGAGGVVKAGKASSRIFLYTGSKLTCFVGGSGGNGGHGGDGGIASMGANYMRYMLKDTYTYPVHIKGSGGTGGASGDGEASTLYLDAEVLCSSGSLVGYNPSLGTAGYTLRVGEYDRDSTGYREDITISDVFYGGRGGSIGVNNGNGADFYFSDAGVISRNTTNDTFIWSCFEEFMPNPSWYQGGAGATPKSGAAGGSAVNPIYVVWSEVSSLHSKSYAGVYFYNNGGGGGAGGSGYDGSSRPIGSSGGYCAIYSITEKE